MSEVKHTPGPWKAHRTVSGDYQIRFGGKGGWLAEVFDDDEPVEGRTEADARLIAAAPELKDALAAMLDFWGGYECPEVDAAIAVMQEIGEDRWSMQAQMDAAIAKATGSAK